MTLLLLLVGGAVVNLLLLDLVIRNPVVAALMLFVVVVVDHSNALPPGFLSFELNVGVNDLMAAMLAAAATARLLRMRYLPSAHRLLLVMIGLALFSIVSGVLHYGQGAVAEARPWVWFLATAAYFATARLSQEDFDRIGRYWVWAGVAMMAVAYLRWGALAGSLPSVSILSYDRGDLRVVRAREALLIAQAFFLVAPLWRNRANLMYRWLGFAMLATVLLLRHRTLWVALVLALFVIMVREPDLGRRFGGLMIVAVLVGGGLFTAFIGGGEEQVEKSASLSTFEWRLEGWMTLLTEEGPDDVVDTAFGLPFGSGWGRDVAGVPSETRPHSHYIEAALRLGVIGLVAMLACYWIVLRKLWRRPPEHARGLLTGDVLLYLLVTQLVLSMTYDLRETGGLVLGLAMARVLRVPDPDHRPAARTPASIGR